MAQPTPDFPEFRRGQPVPLAELKRINDLANRVSDPFRVQSSGPGLETDYDAGLSIIGPPDVSIRAQITAQNGGDSQYDWVETQTAFNTGGVPEELSKLGGLASIPGTFTAVERNGNTTVPIGTFVDLWLGDDGQTWFFNFDASTASTDQNLNITNDTINVNESLVNLTNTRITVNSPTYVTGIGPLIFTAPFEVCGFQFWCCQSDTFTTTNVYDWQPPAAATVYTLSTTASNTTIWNIVPYGTHVVQGTPGSTGNGVTSQADSFSVLPAATSQIVVKVNGASAAGLAAFGVTDNQTPANTYVRDTFLQDGTSGVFAGVWRCAAPVVNAATFTVRFTYTGTAGVVSIQADEVYSPTPLVLDGNSAASGVGLTATPGSLTPTATFEYQALSVGSNDATGTATIGTPAGYTADYEQLGGTLNPGLAAHRLFSSTPPTFPPTNPATTFDASCHWTAAQAIYQGSALPQLLALDNESQYPILLGNDSPGIAGGAQFQLPYVYTSYTGAPLGKYLELDPYDSVVLWYDACNTASWYVLAAPQMTWTLVGVTRGVIPAFDGTTMGTGSVYVQHASGANLAQNPGPVILTVYNPSYAPVPDGVSVTLSWEKVGAVFLVNWSALGCQAQDDTATTTSEPILNIKSDDITRLTVTKADDTANKRTTYTLSAKTGPLTVDDTHGHSVSDVTEIKILDGTNTTGTVASGGTGIAEVTYDASGGSSSITSYSAGTGNGVDFNPSGTYSTVTSLLIVIPAGIYQIAVDGCYKWTPSAGQAIQVRLFDGSAAIGNTDPTIIDQIDYTTLGGTAAGTFSVRSFYQTTGSATITLQASTTGASNTFIYNSNMFIIATG